MSHEQPHPSSLETRQQFVALWQQGLGIAEIAQRLGLTCAIVQRQARRLQRRGFIKARLGIFPSAQALHRVIMFLSAWADEPDINEVFLGQLRHLARLAGSPGQTQAQACHRHACN